MEKGAYVFITRRRQTELDKAVKEIGKCVKAVRSDVSNLEDLNARIGEENINLRDDSIRPIGNEKGRF